MSIPLFTHYKTIPAVSALLGDNPLRLYPFGQAPRQSAKPYAVWQRIGGAPVQYLGSPPDCKQNTLQLDIYADSAQSARAVADILATHLPINAPFRVTALK